MTIRIIQGFKCLKCFSNIYVDKSPDSVRHNDVCSCGYCALILNTENIIHLYCDDIRAIMQCDIILQDDVPINHRIECTSNSFLFQDYSFSTQPLNFQEGTKFIKDKTSTKARKAFRRR